MKTEININKGKARKPFSKNKETNSPIVTNVPNTNHRTLPKIIILSTFTPRECGIATYTSDLVHALNKTYDTSFNIKVCALESNTETHTYDKEQVEIVLNTDRVQSYVDAANHINADQEIGLVMVQHEFGLFKKNIDVFHSFLNVLNKPIAIAFHTVLPNPDSELEHEVKELAALAKYITVMTHASADLLINSYGISPQKIQIISHGTHLVRHKNQNELKQEYGLYGRKIMSTFGFLGPGKSIETTILALPKIIEKHPDVMFLIVGKTHPTLFNTEGDRYMNTLKDLIENLKLHEHVRFINKFVPLPQLLDYLQLSDCYVFTSKDPNQAVSGTFSYALSCGCPIVSTPIPHAKEVLKEGNGIFFDFGNAEQLAEAVQGLLSDEKVLNDMRIKSLQTSQSTAWENSAIAHGQMFAKLSKLPLSIHFKKPEIRLDHLKYMTTEVGIIQFSKINNPDIASGYTLDDNARALIAVCEYYKLTQSSDVKQLIKTYINFILKCQREDGRFYNYVDASMKFTKQNQEVNLEDANGRAIWALGYVCGIMEENLDLETTVIQNIKWSVNQFLPHSKDFKSPRALAFIIKGLYYYNAKAQNKEITNSISHAANKLVDLYKFHSEERWEWFENYLTYANSILPEALLYAWKATNDLRYSHISKVSFDFLLSKIFKTNTIKVISNQNWLIKDFENEINSIGGEQPIDVAYTILALKQFNILYPKQGYDQKMEAAFNWFLGQNELNQIIYNPCTGGCFDGLEERNVNLNQGAESTVSYLLARLAFEDVMPY